MKILLVDDDQALGEHLAAKLKEADYEVDLADNGEDGEALARAGKPDLIVLDVMLPGKDGYEVCRSLRADGFEMPIMMLTARGLVEDRIRGLDYGADDYLAKPFVFEELLARLRALRRRAVTAEPTVLKAGDLELDCLRRVARRAGRTIELSTREFQLLEALIRNPGKTMTRSVLLREIWEEEGPAPSNVLDVYLTFLRRKLEPPDLPRIIYTVRGQGYVLRPTGSPTE